MKSRINRDGREVSISELWWYIISKWKWLVIGMVVGAMIFGAYEAYKLNTTSNVEQPKEITIKDLTEEEQEEVKALIREYELYQAEVERLDKNFLMNLDYNLICRCLITYYVDTDYSYNYLEVNENYTDELMALYKTYIKSDVVFEEILACEIEGLEERDLYYMISTMNEGGVLRIDIHADKDACEKIAEKICDAMTEYYSVATEIVGEHTATLTSVYMTSVYSDTIKNAQSIQINYLNTLSDELERNKAVLTSQQRYVYNSEINNEIVKEDIEEYDEEKTIEINNVVMGAMIGIVIVIMTISLIYICGKKIKTISELNQIYEVELLGKILTNNINNKYILKKINNIKTNLNEEEQKRYIVQTIIQKCKQSKIVEVSICSTVEGVADKVIDIIKELNDVDINCKYVGNINYDVDALDMIMKGQNVIFVEQLGVTTKDDFETEIEICDKFSVNILGVVVFI